MLKQIAILFFVVLDIFPSYAEYIDYPHVEKQSVWNYVITMIDYGDTYTNVYFGCKDIGNRRREFSKFTYLIDSKGVKHQIQSINGKPLNTDALYIDTNAGNENSFWITFSVSLSGMNKFSIIDEKTGGFIFKNIRLYSDYAGYANRCQIINAHFKSNNTKQKKLLRKDPNFKIE